MVVVLRTADFQSHHVYGQFEANAGRADASDFTEEGADASVIREAIEGGLQRARAVFERGYKDLKDKGLKEEVRYGDVDRVCRN